jgi:hypothetical protein
MFDLVVKNLNNMYEISSLIICSIVILDVFVILWSGKKEIAA